MGDFVLPMAFESKKTEEICVFDSYSSLRIPVLLILTSLLLFLFLLLLVVVLLLVLVLVLGEKVIFGIEKKKIL